MFAERMAWVWAFGLFRKLDDRRIQCEVEDEAAEDRKVQRTRPEDRGTYSGTLKTPCVLYFLDFLVELNGRHSLLNLCEFCMMW